MTTTTVSSGQSSAGLVVSAGDTLAIQSGATVTATTVYSGGTVFDSGAAIATALGTTVSLGGTLIATGSTTGTVIERTGLEIVSSGGIASQTTIGFGGLQILSNGGAATGTTVGFEGAEYVQSGGSATGTVLSGLVTSQVIFAGGTGTGTTIGSGSLLLVEGGASGIAAGLSVQADVLAGGQMGLLQARGSGDVVNGGVEQVLGKSTETGGTVENGGTIVVANLGTLVAPTIATGGTVYVSSGAVLTGPVSFAGSGAVLAIEQTPSIAVAFGGFVAGDTIDFTSIAYVSGTTVALLADGDLGLVAGGATTDLGIAPIGGNPNFLAVTDTLSGTDLIQTPCFAAGTRIRTPHGEVPVESLRIGDRVCTARDGAAREIVWVGRRAVDCSRHPRPASVWPVRIEAGAIAPGMPQAALHLSPDHAVYLRGRLFPVHTLVNGASIAQVPLANVTYHHVELAAHDVVLAEGLPCETYLDAGNRAAFGDAPGAVALHPDFARRKWQQESCAELVFDGPVLTDIRAALIARADALGHAISNDPMLRVVCNGTTCDAMRDGDIWWIRLPADATEIEIVTRHYTPAHLEPASDDWRMLGVAIGAIRLDEAHLALDDFRLGAGWHPGEPDIDLPAWRWTDGRATIACMGARLLELTVVGTGRYRVAPEAVQGSERWRQAM